jgi:hypothetical protein
LLDSESIVGDSCFSLSKNCRQSCCPGVEAGAAPLQRTSDNSTVLLVLVLPVAVAAELAACCAVALRYFDKAAETSALECLWLTR